LLEEIGIKWQYAIKYLNSPLCVPLCLTTTEPAGGEVRTTARADVAKDKNKREAIANIMSLSRREEDERIRHYKYVARSEATGTIW
jgi:hypothetical protein